MRFLSCVGCGCATDGDYRAALVASLPRLKKLDGVDVTGRERDDAMAAFGEDEDEDEGERGRGGRGEPGRPNEVVGRDGARRERRSAAKAVGSSARNESTAASSSSLGSATPLDLARYEPCSRCSRTPRCSSTRWEPR